MSHNLLKNRRSLANMALSTLLISQLFACKTATQNDNEEPSQTTRSGSSNSDRVGVWMTNVGSDVMYSKSKIERSLDRVAQFGVNSVYPVVWNKAEVFFKSETVKEELGSEFIAAPDNMDVLLEVIKSAANRGMSTYAWYENGLKVPIRKEGGDFYKLGQKFIDKGWLTKNNQGEYYGKCEFGVCKGFLNPVNPEVRAFLVKFFGEIAKYYGVKGVMIDDHFSLDPTFGYDSYTRSQYRNYISENGLKDNYEQFNKFRSDAIVTLVNELKREVHKYGKKLILSPGGEPDWAKKTWLQDWEKMVWTKAVDEIIMQSYRYNMSSFMMMLYNRKVQNLAKHVDFGVAILFGLKTNKSMNGQLIHDQTKFAKQQGYQVSYFYLDTIDTRATEKETAADRKLWLDKTSKLIRN